MDQRICNLIAMGGKACNALRNVVRDLVEEEGIASCIAIKSVTSTTMRSQRGYKAVCTKGSHLADKIAQD